MIAFFFVLFAAGAVVAMYLSSRPQDIRQQASVGTGDVYERIAIPACKTNKVFTNAPPNSRACKYAGSNWNECVEGYTLILSAGGKSGSCVANSKIPAQCKTTLVIRDPGSPFTRECELYGTKQYECIDGYKLQLNDDAVTGRCVPISVSCTGTQVYDASRSKCLPQCTTATGGPGQVKPPTNYHECAWPGMTGLYECNAGSYLLKSQNICVSLSSSQKCPKNSVGKVDAVANGTAHSYACVDPNDPANGVLFVCESNYTRIPHADGSSHCELIAIKGK